MAFKQHNKKILGEILCVRNGVAVSADEGENRSPVNLAKLAERIARRLSSGAALGARKNDTPACGGETSREMPGRNAGFRSHGRELWYLRIC